MGLACARQSHKHWTGESDTAFEEIQLKLVNKKERESLLVLRYLKRFFNGENPVIYISVVLPDGEVMQNPLPS